MQKSREIEREIDYNDNIYTETLRTLITTNKIRRTLKQKQNKTK